MGIRALTTNELEVIKVAKEKANEQLKEIRAKIQGRRRLLSYPEKEKLNRDLAEFEPVSGHPVIAVVNDTEILLDYEFLRKFTKTFGRRKYSYSFRVEGTDQSRRLTVDYHHRWPGQGHGTASLFEIPLRKRDLLHGLPKIELPIVN